MRNETRQLFNQYLERIASLNGIDSSAQKFAAAPAVEQKLENRLQDSSAFLQRINFVPVDNQQGEKIGIEISGTIARTVDTSSSGERQPADPPDLDDIGYICTQTNYDTALRYAKLDAWRHHPDFQARLRDAILKRQALDRLLIGFNGISRAATSADHAKLSDVNKGWLQKLREHDSGSQVLDQSGDTPGVVSYGEAGDYANLDALVYDATQTYIDPQYRDSVELVTIVGRSIMHDKLFPLVNQDNAPTETQAADILLGSKRLGGLQAM